MKVICFTNLDHCKYGWPTELPAVPNVGDTIYSTAKTPKGYHLYLKVCSVTWKPIKKPSEFPSSNETEDYDWVPYIELNCDGSITEFYERFYGLGYC